MCVTKERPPAGLARAHARDASTSSLALRTNAQATFMAKQADLALLPWRSCPWVLERTNVRSFDPPLWCFSLAKLGKSDCEAAYVISDTTKQYHRCIWSPASASKDEAPSCKMETVGCASTSSPQTASASLQTASMSSKPASSMPSRNTVAVRPPPPPAPSPSPWVASGLRKVNSLSAAMSSKYHASLYPASAAIDGDFRSLAATGKQVGNWISVQIPSETVVDTVAVYNRPDNSEYQAWLSPFEIWVGTSFGDANSKTSVRCGTPALKFPVGAGPYVVDCGELQGSYVTLKQTDDARHLTIAELVIYAATSAGYPFSDSALIWPPPPSPPPLPVQIQSSSRSASSPTSASHIAASSPTLLVLRVPTAPSLVSADCRSITLRWSTTAPGALPHSQRYALFYAPAAAPAAERPWSTGLRETRATVTGLQPGMEYAFAVAEAVANAASPELGPRSTKAIFATKAKCEVGPASTKCHSGGAGVEEQHRLGAPQVNPLSCSALALELPPLPPDHCDDDRDQRLAVEARHGQSADQEGWTEIRHNVLSQTVIVGGLVASQSYEFRTVLHRPRLGDRFSESSGLVVVEEGAVLPNSTILSAPVVRADRRGSLDVFVISWSRGAGACRAGLPFALQAASVHDNLLVPGQDWLDTPERMAMLDWHTLDANATIGEAVVSLENIRRVCTRKWCTFRLLPVGVNGWVEPTHPSRPIDVALHGSVLIALMWVIFLVLLASLVTFLTNEPEARRADFWLERLELLRSTPWMEHFETLRQTPWEEYLDIARRATMDVSHFFSANVQWLTHAWMDGAFSVLPARFGGADHDTGSRWERESNGESRLAPTCSDSDDEEDVEMDEFAPLPGASTVEPTAIVLQGSSPSTHKGRVGTEDEEQLPLQPDDDPNDAVTRL